MKKRLQCRNPALNYYRTNVRDNALGYTKANTQVVLVAINLAKNEFSETEFLDLMRAYVARNDNSCA